MITYLFPPCGGSGVQRNLKYVKYMPLYGWKPYVLTSKDLNYHVYDYSLLNDIPQEAMIIRTESVDPYRLTALMQHTKIGTNNLNTLTSLTLKDSYITCYRKLRDFLAIPDAILGWIPFAIYYGIKAIRQYNIGIILGCGFYTEAIISKILSDISGIPYILDFRDAWTDNSYLKFPTRFHLHAHKVLERFAVKNATGVCVYGEYLANRFVKRYPILENRVQVITNGFDSQDLHGIAAFHVPKGKRRIVYSGSLYKHHDILFSSLLEALVRLPQSILATLEIVFVGRVEIEDAKQRVIRNELTDHVKFTGYLPHREALAYLLSADASLLFLRPGDVESYTGKIFEYFMVQKPILALVEPDGICASLLQSVGLADWTVPPGDSERLCKTIIALSESGWPQPSPRQTEHFSRKHLTKNLCAFLSSVVDSIPAHKK